MVHDCFEVFLYFVVFLFFVHLLIPCYSEACLKDNFLLLDQVVDPTVSHKLLSFMDAFGVIIES